MYLLLHQSSDLQMQAGAVLLLDINVLLLRAVPAKATWRHTHLAVAAHQELSNPALGVELRFHFHIYIY